MNPKQFPSTIVIPDRSQKRGKRQVKRKEVLNEEQLREEGQGGGKKESGEREEVWVEGVREGTHCKELRRGKRWR